MNASALATGPTNASLPPSTPPVELPDSLVGFDLADKTAIALLVSSAVGSIMVLIGVTIMLVVVTKQLARLVAVLRGDEDGTSVHTGLLSGTGPPAPDAFAVRESVNGGVASFGDGGSSSNSNSNSSSSSSSSTNKGILKKPIGRLPTLTKHERRKKTDENNTSCAIAEVDEEEDHTL